VQRQLQWVSGRPGEAPAYTGTAFIIAGLALFRRATVSWTLPRDILNVGLANCGGEDVSRWLKLLCLKQNIENLSTIQERSGYLLWQRERAVCRQLGSDAVLELLPGCR
jgi:hypothetical protein